MTNATIVFLLRDNQICLGFKKRGHGVGKWNGFGGKVEEGESPKQAAKRELYEESGVEANELDEVADISYKEVAKNWRVKVFLAHKWKNDPKETEEMGPKWFKISEIPYEKMWDNDSIWIPKVLKGEKFKATFLHDSRGKIKKYSLVGLKK